MDIKNLKEAQNLANELQDLEAVYIYMKTDHCCFKVEPAPTVTSRAIIINDKDLCKGLAMLVKERMDIINERIKEL